MSKSVFLLSEADLNGLVDGHIEPDRRADVLRRLAVSPRDRATVEAWQEQNDLIRAAFQDIEREPLPVSLDLAPPPRLTCITGGGPTLLATPPTAVGSRGRAAAGLATFILVAAGLGGSWLLMEPGRDQGADLAFRGGLALRGTIDATLANRAAAALEREAAPRHDRRRPTVLAGALPTATIPDLGQAGFSLTSAETEATEPASLVFHYQNSGSERLVISAARAPREATTTAPARIGGGFSWHRRDTAFAIAGTVPPERLRAIAVALEGDGADE